MGSVAGRTCGFAALGVPAVTRQPFEHQVVHLPQREFQLRREFARRAAGEAGRGEIHKRSAACVLHAGNMLKTVLDHAVQIHGGNGFMWEAEVNCLYRAGKLIEIGAGTTQVRQLIIAGELLKA